MKKIITLFGISVLFLLGASAVSACTCLSDTKTPVKKQVKAAYKDATAVFYGEVTEITRQPNGFAVKIKVEQSWKGQIEKETIVYTSGNGGMCGYTFEKGVKYLVYASGENSILGVSLCSRTNPSNRDAKYLSKIKTPKAFDWGIEY